MKPDVTRSNMRRHAAVIVSLLLLAGCATPPSGLQRAGPSTSEVRAAGAATESHARIQLVVIDDAVARRLIEQERRDDFAYSLADGQRRALQVGPGDTLEISVWEAPPATLFGPINADPRLIGGSALITSFPPQVVDHDGTITVPFAGRIAAGGRTPREIESQISSTLRDKTNQLQVLVRIVQNASANVTVVGEVRGSTRVSLTPGGERLLDVLAAAGGVTQPVGKMTLQVTRGNQIRAMPLDSVIRDPRQNVVMRAGDVVTAIHQPYAFSVLGASGRNEEIPFEASGITLAQALARSGGANDNRADPRGLFIFRYEPADTFAWEQPVATTAEGRVAVVYQLDLTDPSSFLVAQRFPMRDHDVLYVSNAPAAELQKFLNIITSVLTPVLGITNLTR